MVKIFFILICFLRISFVICKLDYQHEGFQWKGIINPIISFFNDKGHSSIKFHIANTTNHELMDVGNEILKSSVNVKILLTSSNLVEDKSPVILILNSLSEFSELLIKNDNSKYYLIILLNELNLNFDKILKTFWNHSKLNVNFLVKNQENISIFTFFPFDKNCGEELILKLISSYSQNWTLKNFYPNKIKNLKKCEIKIGMSPADPFNMIEIDNRTNSKTVNGLEVDIIKNLSDELNFHPSFHGPYFDIGTIFSNGSSIGLMSLPHEKKVDVIIGGLSLQLERLKYLSRTAFYMTDALILTMPPTSTISSFQKLYMPFDVITWSLIIAIYIMGVIIVTLTRRMSGTVYEFIVGQNVNHPILNMLIAIVGGSQIKLPQKVFSRFILVKFLLFCLVMRALYQGKLFDIMRRNIYEKNAESFDELIDKKFNFYTYESLSRRVQGFKFAQR